MQKRLLVFSIGVACLAALSASSMVTSFAKTGIRTSEWSKWMNFQRIAQRHGKLGAGSFVPGSSGLVSAAPGPLAGFPTPSPVILGGFDDPLEGMHYYAVVIGDNSGKVWVVNHWNGLSSSFSTGTAPIQSTASTSQARNEIYVGTTEGVVYRLKATWSQGTFMLTQIGRYPATGTLGAPIKGPMLLVETPVNQFAEVYFAAGNNIYGVKAPYTNPMALSSLWPPRPAASEDEVFLGGVTMRLDPSEITEPFPYSTGSSDLLYVCSDTPSHTGGRLYAIRRGLQMIGSDTSGWPGPGTIRWSEPIGGGVSTPLAVPEISSQSVAIHHVMFNGTTGLWDHKVSWFYDQEGGAPEGVVLNSYTSYFPAWSSLAMGNNLAHVYVNGADTRLYKVSSSGVINNTPPLGGFGTGDPSHQLGYCTPVITSYGSGGSSERILVGANHIGPVGGGVQMWDGSSTSTSSLLSLLDTQFESSLCAQVPSKWFAVTSSGDVYRLGP